MSEANRAAERERAERTELLQVVHETVRGLSLLANSLVDLHNSRRAYVLDTKPVRWDSDEYRAVTAQLTASWTMLAALGRPVLASKLAELLGHADTCVKTGDNPTDNQADRLARIEQWWEPFTTATANLLSEFQQLLGASTMAKNPPIQWNPRTSKYYRPESSNDRQGDNEDN
ncbi:hypothetical protein [Nocardia wallacei]|uniref:hypothetical protein n=1 Tax=Nocardia wallacei TaxID=480035 RepID=UPI00245820CB|nr:hypothetical protein [Nocardia wallacei]